MTLCPIASCIYVSVLLAFKWDQLSEFLGQRSPAEGVSLYLDTQGEVASPARDYRVETSVSGWYNWLQQSRLAAPGCPACTSGGTPQPQGMYTYRLEARVARFYAAWPALRGYRS